MVEFTVVHNSMGAGDEGTPQGTAVQWGCGLVYLLPPAGMTCGKRHQWLIPLPMLTSIPGHREPITGVGCLVSSLELLIPFHEKTGELTNQQATLEPKPQSV